MKKENFWRKIPKPKGITITSKNIGKIMRDGIEIIDNIKLQSHPIFTPQPPEWEDRFDKEFGQWDSVKDFIAEILLQERRRMIKILPLEARVASKIIAEREIDDAYNAGFNDCLDEVKTLLNEKE